MGAISSQVEIDLFQTTDQRQDLVALDGSASVLAKMGPAAEGARFINQALPRIGLQHGASPIRTHGQGFSAGGPKRLGGEEGFTPGELGDFSGKPKLAAFRSAQAVSLDRPAGQLRINGTDFLKTCCMAFHEEIAELALGEGREPGVRIWAGPTWP